MQTRAQMRRQQQIQQQRPTQFRFVYGNNGGLPRGVTIKQFLINEIRRNQVDIGRVRNLNSLNVSALTKLILLHYGRQANSRNRERVINLMAFQLDAPELASVISEVIKILQREGINIPIMITINGNVHRPASPQFMDMLRRRRIGQNFNWDAEADYEEYMGSKVIYTITLTFMPPNVPDDASVQQIPHFGFLPFAIREEHADRCKNEPNWIKLKETWERYVPPETSQLDCLGWSLKLLQEQGKVPPGTVERYLAFHINYASYDMRQKDFKPLARELNLNINIHTDRTRQGHSLRKYRAAVPQEAYATIELCAVREHIFIMERTDFTPFSINSPDSPLLNEETDRAIKQTQRTARPTRHYTVRNHGRTFQVVPDSAPNLYLSSYNFIIAMINNPLFTRPASAFEIKSNPVSERSTTLRKADRVQINYATSGLDEGFDEPMAPVTGPSEYKFAHNPFDDFVARAMRQKRKHWQAPAQDSAHQEEERQAGPDYVRLFADFETFPHTQSHKLYADLLHVRSETGVVRTYVQDMNDPSSIPPAQQFFDDICSGVFGTLIPRFIVICHNLGFDVNFFIHQCPRLRIIDQIKKSSSRVNCMMAHYVNPADDTTKRIYFKDSYSVIPMALSKFNSTFGFEESDRKGDCPHGYFNEHTIRDRWAPIAEAVKYAAQDEADFRQDIAAYVDPERPDTHYDHRQHRIDYCAQDVSLLERGYNLFRQWTAELFLGEELDFCVSAPQIAFNFARNKNSFEGVCKVRGLTLQWLNENFVYGGRCMTAHRKKWHTHMVSDLDAVGLYTTAMSSVQLRLPRGPGKHMVFEGEANRRAQRNFNPDDYFDFFAAIRLTSTPLKRDFAFPLLRTKEQGYSNMIGRGDIIHVSKTYLEELIEYVGISYEVLGGLFWPAGIYPERNNLRETVMYLHEMRAEHKRQGKKSEVILKLISNSIYGRMLMKPPDTVDHWIDTIEDDPFNASAPQGSSVIFNGRHLPEMPSNHPLRVSEPRVDPMVGELITSLDQHEEVEIADEEEPRRKQKKRKRKRRRGGNRFIDDEAGLDSDEEEDEDDDEEEEGSDDEDKAQQEMAGFIVDDDSDNLSFKSDSSGELMNSDSEEEEVDEDEEEEEEEEDDSASSNSLDEILMMDDETWAQMPVICVNNEQDDRVAQGTLLGVGHSAMEWFLHDTKFSKYFYRHFHYIKEIVTFGNKACITRYKNTTRHTNFAHVGSNILDMSKRIMNQVMVLAEENSIQIYYQDTDSMHLKQSDIPLLDKLFRDKYQRNMLGNDLGQFNSDFKVPRGYGEEVAVESYFCAPKSYLDVVESKLLNADEFDPVARPMTLRQFHIRLKGVPQQSILAYCHDNFMTPLDLYARLYKGEKVQFDVLCENRVSFDFKKDFTVVSKMEFTRDIQFI